MDRHALRLPLLFAATAALAVLLNPGPGRAQDDGATWDLPIGQTSVEPEDPDTIPNETGDPEFYNERIPAESDSVIYVVDRSSSMMLPTAPFVGDDGQMVTDGSRLDYVKAELKRSVASLPESFSFNMIIYCECVEKWQPERVPASPAWKAKAVAWIDAITPWGWTNTGGATSTALDDHGNKSVLLLSDGAPNFLDCAQTYIADPEQHRVVIRNANAQRAVINTFGIGLDPETRAFMSEVAADAGGAFREID